MNPSNQEDHRANDNENVIATTSLHIRIRSDLLARLDRAAQRAGVGRGETVRRYLSDGLAAAVREDPARFLDKLRTEITPPPGEDQ